MRLWLLTLMLAVLVGCGQEEPPSPYQIYFPARAGTLYGSAFAGEDYPVTQGETPTVTDLLEDLLDGPADATLVSPFPPGTKLLWVELEEDGILQVNLTEEYSGLTGIALTLADYCIVYTACQIDGIEGVEILSANQQNPFRNHNILRLEDISPQ